MSNEPKSNEPMDFHLRDREIASAIFAKLRGMDQSITIMHVCGGHQDTLVRHGIDRQLADVGVDVRQGPGCPVCVTTQLEIEEVALLANSGVTVTAFGDIMRVPGESGTLLDAKARGGDVRMVYSVQDAIGIARENPEKQVVFMGIGFETTAPSSAAALRSNTPENFSLLSTHRYVPPALAAILNMGEVRLQGLIEPGHVCTIIGLDPLEFISSSHGVPQVVAGFEPLDLLMAILMLARQIKEGRAELENGYTRVVRKEGNKLAVEALADVFEPADIAWRGFGVIPGSGMAISPRYSHKDARIVHADILAPLAGREFPEPPGCKCGEVLRGVLRSEDCSLFGKGCTPKSPIGPCMVTSEGSCAIVYKYGR